MAGIFLSAESIVKTNAKGIIPTALMKSKANFSLFALFHFFRYAEDTGNSK